MFKRRRIKSQQIEALETRQAELTKENEELKAMLSKDCCVGNHCRACDNYYGDVFGGVCTININCKHFERRFVN